MNVNDYTSEWSDQFALRSAVLEFGGVKVKIDVNSAC